MVIRLRLARRTLVIVRGNDKVFDVTVTKGSRPLDITDAEVTCEVKDKRDGRFLFAATITKIDPANGRFFVRFPKEETARLLPYQRIHFDFRFVFADGMEKNYPTPPFQAIAVDRVTD
jgi:hypothetical protein